MWAPASAATLTEIGVFRSANALTRVQRLGRLFPGQLSGLRDSPLDLRAAVGHHGSGV